MSRLVVVSNRVAPISEGEPTAGGLAAGVMDALKQKGGIWFGWSGEITAGAESLRSRMSNDHSFVKIFSPQAAVRESISQARPFMRPIAKRIASSDSFASICRPQ